MPGRVVMEQQQESGPQDLKKDRSNAQEGTLPLKQVSAADSHNDTDQKLPQNGLSNTVMAMTGLPTPPELDQSWRETPANKHMGVLIERLAQQCYSDLGVTLTKMAETPESGQANGVIPHAVDTSEASLSKKRTLMDFANTQRDRFIKTLVLSDWARSEKDMARLVDIKVWQESQVSAQLGAINFIGVTKSDMQGAKMLNPNIDGALDLLATGKSRMPDMGYLPPTKLSAKQLLRTLQDMNVALATRLNLHEDLPYYFSDFSIANGRATFRVSNEFEVDLSIGDEDTSAPFWFIDMRFLFSPTPDITDDVSRMELEKRVNIALASDTKLQGCYDLLHNFVLTHKINVLRDQAGQLLREKWFDRLFVEMKKRVLIIQYWSDVPGPKSWLEFGVSTGRHNRTRSKPANAQISVRWFRRGQEVQDDTVAIDWSEMNAERVLACVIAKHTSWSLQNAKESLVRLAGPDSKLDITVKLSADTPEDCSLSLALPGMRTPYIVRREVVTGKWAISPPTLLATRTERLLNSDTNADVAVQLAQLLCGTSQERIAKAADLAGWKSVSSKTMAPQNNLKTLFGSDVISRSIYNCSRGWGESWVLVGTFSLSGDKWWATRMEPRLDARGSVPGNIIAETRQISLPFDLVARPGVARSLLLRIETLAAAEVSLAVVTQELASKRIPYNVENLASLSPAKRSSSARPGRETTEPAVILDSAPLFPDSKFDTPRKSFKSAILRLTHSGLVTTPSINDSVAEVRHCLRLTVENGSLSHLQQYLIGKPRDADMSMTTAGALALRIRTPFGKPCVSNVIARLETCKRLDSYLAALAGHNCSCTHLSDSRISWRYQTDPELSATLQFSLNSNSPPSADLKFFPIDSNPHQRIRVQALRKFNLAPLDPVSFDGLLANLNTCLSLNVAFSSISSNFPLGSLNIHSHDLVGYKWSYSAPLPGAGVIFKTQWRAAGPQRKKGAWHIMTQLSAEKRGSGIDDEVRERIMQVCLEQGEGRWGDGKQIVVEPEKVGEVVEALDRAVREAGGGGVGKKEEVKVEGSAPESLNAASGASSGQRPGVQRTASTQRTNGNGTGGSDGTGRLKQEVIELD